MKKVNPKKRKQILFILFQVFLAFVFVGAYGQTSKPITGKVSDDAGKPLANVSVTVKGTTRGTTTNDAGSFTVNVNPQDKTLVFGSVGFTSQEFSLSSSTNSINIKLQSSQPSSLDDVVVVGYGTQKKATLTGSVTTVNAKAFQDKGAVDNPIGALQGQVPGVVVTRNSAAPGRQGWSFQIRGQTSVNGSDPLVIVDGIPLTNLNALNSINPNDIESMSFLKDAATAIYGARGAGGVVLVTTKTAKAGKTVIQYDGSVSSKLLGLQPHLLNVKQYGQGLIDATSNDYYAGTSYGTLPTSFIWYRMGLLQLNAPDSGYLDFNKQYNMDWTTGKLTYVGTPVSPSANGANPGFGDVKDITFFNTNYADLLWGTATSTQHNISISGRSANSGYRLSIGYMDDGSLLKWGNNSNKRYNVRLTHDYEFSKSLKVETNLSLEEQDIVQPTNTGYLGQYQQPGFPVQTLNGKPYAWGTQYSSNWQAALGGDTKEYDTRIFGSLKATYSFSKHLRLIGQSSYNANFTDISTQTNSISWWNNNGTIQAADNPTQANSALSRNYIKNPYYNLNAYLEYQNTFKSVHNVGLTLGTNYERSESDGYTATTTYLANNSIPSLNLSIGNNTTKLVTEAQSHTAIGSYFGRFNYGYKGKYLLEADARYDGSSKFIAANRWKFFYGFSAGWRISEEEFMKSQKIFSDLKLRASWGQVGNQNGIGNYDYLQLLNVSASGGNTSSGVPLIGSSTVVYIGPTNSLVSLNRTWETVETKNLGLDFSLLHGKLIGSFDYFIKDNKNMLLGQTFPAVLGAVAPAANIGHLRTWGWEGALTWSDHIGKLGYHIGGTMTDNQNKLIYYGGANIMNPGYNSFVQGYAIGTYFGLQYAGRVQTQAQADAANAMNAGNNIAMPNKLLNAAGGIVTPGVRIGDNSFKDVNGDGKLSTPGDLVNLGRDDPRYSYSANLGFDYQGFDFSVIFQGVGKRTVFRNDNWSVPEGSIYQGQSNFWYGNTWTPTHTDAYYPILGANQNSTTYNTYNYQISSWSVQNGAYIRLKNLVVGYTLPANTIKKLGIQKLRIYVSGSDLWETTHIKDGWDPETQKDVGRSGQSPFQRYPFYRFLTGGVSVTF